MILASLLMEPNRIVSTDHIVDTIWDSRPPDTARTQVQICVSRLRKSLSEANVHAPITMRPPGYVLQLDGDQLDAQVFTRRVAAARELSREGRSAQAADLLREAVALWRGPCLNGITSRTLRTKAVRLDEDRLTAIETYLELELHLGRHHQLIGEIGRLVHEFPLRERLRAQLMLALSRSGRQAEALATYRVGRDLLIEELGLEPSEELRQLESAILSGDSALQAGWRPEQPDSTVPQLAGSAAPAPPQREEKPHQLPPDTADFVGSEALIRSAEAVLTGADGHRAVGIVVIVGRPGVGKSTMATHIAHRLGEEHFPDCQLYCDLRGTTAEPAAAAGVLGRFLRALGIPGPMVPADLDERAEMYRTLVAHRRVLVVLDDAATESQIMPLLPGSPSCAVLVTSRARLTGVPGAHLVELDVLDTPQSVQLLARVVGADRVAREPEAARALVRTVGGLPLALRIIAARLAARPHWSLASMVHRLANERHRLDELAHGEMTIRASLSLTHDGLDPANRRLLRLLSLAEGPTFPGWLAGALLADDRPRPSDLLEPLVDVQMLDVAAVESTGELRYRFHDIIRMFAREQLLAHDARPTQVAAIARMVGGWLALAEQAHRRIYGGDFTVLHSAAPRWQPPPGYLEQALTEPLEWLDAEQANLCAAVEQAAETGLDELCWDLAGTLPTLFEARGYLDHWETTHRQALAAVRRAGNKRGTAAMLSSLGTLYLNRCEPERSRAALDAALALFAELDDPRGLALCRRDLALLERQRGEDERALTLYDQAMRDFQRVDDVVGRAIVLTQSAHIRMRRGHSAQAHAQLAEALEIYRAVGYAGGEAHALRRVGQVLLRQGRHRQAEQTMTEALTMVRRGGDVIGEGHLLHNLGEISADSGRYEQARDFFNQALAIREQIMDHAGAAVVRLALARVLVRTGHPVRAGELLEHAMSTFRDRSMDREHEQARQLSGSLTGGSPVR